MPRKKNNITSHGTFFSIPKYDKVSKSKKKKYIVFIDNKKFCVLADSKIAISEYFNIDCNYIREHCYETDSKDIEVDQVI